MIVTYRRLHKNSLDSLKVYLCRPRTLLWRVCIVRSVFNGSRVAAVAAHDRHAQNDDIMKPLKGINRRGRRTTRGDVHILSLRTAVVLAVLPYYVYIFIIY